MNCTIVRHHPTHLKHQKCHLSSRYLLSWLSKYDKFGDYNSASHFAADRQSGDTSQYLEMPNVARNSSMAQDRGVTIRSGSGNSKEHYKRLPDEQ